MLTSIGRLLARGRAIGTGMLLLLATLAPAESLADTCYSNVATSGNWSAAGNWTNCGGGVPGTGDTAIIVGGDTITADTAVSVGAVIIESGATLNISNRNWTVNGTTEISGTLVHTNSNGSSVFVGLVTVNSGGTWNNAANEANIFRGGITNNGTWTHSGGATQTFSTNSQVIGGNSPIEFGGDVDVSGAITVTNNNTSTVTIDGILDGTSGGSTWVNGTGATLNYVSDSNREPMDTGSLVASANPNTVIYARGGTQIVKSTTYHHLNLTGSSTKSIPTGTVVNGDVTTSGTVTMSVAGTVTINGSLNLGSGTTYDPSSGSIVYLRGDLNNGASSFNASGNTIILDGTGAQTITGSTAFANLTISNSAAPVTTASNITASGTLTINAGGVLSPGSGLTVGGTGALTGSGTARVTRTGTTSDFTSQYTIANKTLTNLTIEYAGSGAQTVSAATYGGLAINNGSGASLATGTTTVSGALTLTSGTLSVGSQTLVLNGPAIAGTPANLSTTAASSLTFGGSSSGVEMPSSVTSLNNLTVNNANGIALNSSLSVAGTLTLTSGPISTGSYILTALGNCTGSVSRPSGGGYVLGKLRLTFPGGTATCTYHIGSSTAYAPMSVTAASSGGTLTGQTNGYEQPQIALSGIDSTKDVNRYWTLGADSGDTINVTTYGVTFNFISADVDIGATTSAFKVGKYASSSWSLINPSSALSTSTSISSVAGPIAKPTDFAIGEAAPTCDVPAYLPSGMSCVCDNFGRATLNPSTIFGGNWSVSSSSGSFGSPRIVTSGYLRMTDNSNNVATAATMPGTFPAAGNLITVEFKHYAYNAAGSGGADGIALTLSDSSVTPVPGAYGGSLGYAQKDDAACAAGGRTPPCNGFNGGWVGIGIDEWGNFSAPTEGRIGGPGQRPDSVSVRGSGSLLSDYPYLSGTAANLSPGIDSPTLTTANPGHAYRITVDARNYTWNGSTGAKTTLVSVERDTTGTGSNYNTLVPSFDAFVVNPSQADVPANWKLSFTGSTGGAVNYHEIAGLKICAQTITPPAGFRIEVDNLAPSTCGTPGGSPSSPVVTITAIDANGNNVTTYTNTVTLSATLLSGGASAAVWTKKPGAANGVLSGNQYTFDPADMGRAQFYLTDASSQDVQITVSETSGTISSSTPSTTPIQYRGGMFTIVEDDTLDYGVVGGRPHTFNITRTTCSGGVTTPDVNYDGAKPLDGWYTPDANHPTGAVAPQICAGTCASNGSCEVISIAAPNLNATSNNAPTLTFVDGVANFCLKTSDVGKYSVFLRDDSNVSVPVTGASPVLTVRPFAVAVSNVTASGNPNPADSSAAGTGGVLTAAGLPFGATVQGYLWHGDADPDGDGLPGAAVWSDLTKGGLASHYADTVALSTGSNNTTDIWPSGGAGANTSLGTVVVASGSGTTSSLTYSEVGSFAMKAVPSTAYLGTSGVDLTPRIVMFTNPNSGDQTSVVGRFRVHHFDLSDAALIDRSDFGGGTGCTPDSSFTYMGERMRIGFTLTARNASNATTTNYKNGYSPLDAAGGWTATGNNTVGFWMNTTNLPAIVPTPLGNTDTCSVFYGANSPWSTTFTCTGTTSHSTIGAAAARVAVKDPVTPVWAGGVGTFTTDVVLERGNAVDGPYGTIGTSNFGSLNLGIWPQDRDGATLGVSPNMDADGAGGNDRVLLSVPATQVRFGRLKLNNANGSELLALQVPVEAQFWNGTAFVTNREDSCTTIPGTTIRMAGYRSNLTACETAVPANLVLNGGRSWISMPAPGAGNNGSVDLTMFLGTATPATTTCTTQNGTEVGTTSGALQYLQGNWLGTPFVNDPTARANFGAFRSGPTIYFREMY